MVVFDLVEFVMVVDFVDFFWLCVDLLLVVGEYCVVFLVVFLEFVEDF